MLKQPYMPNIFLLLHAKVCQFLVNDNRGGCLEKNMTKYDMEEGAKKYNFANHILLNDPTANSRSELTKTFQFKNKHVPIQLVTEF